MNFLAIASEGLYADQHLSGDPLIDELWFMYIVTNGFYAGSNIYYYPQDDSLEGLDLGMEMGL